MKLKDDRHIVHIEDNRFVYERLYYYGDRTINELKEAEKELLTELKQPPFDELFEIEDEEAAVYKRNESVGFGVIITSEKNISELEDILDCIILPKP